MYVARITRRPNLRMFPALAALLVAAACDSSSTTEPEGGSPLQAQFEIKREVQGAAAESILPFVPQVTVKQGQVDIFGQIRTPTPCWSLSSAARRDGSTITYVVTAKTTPAQICAQVLVVRDYGASILNVAGGRYTLRVLHEVEGSRSPEVVLEREIVVP